MSTSAHERGCWPFNYAARDIANSLFQKWAIKGFFPAGERSEPRTRTARRATAGRSPRREAGRAASGVAVPLAFFCTLFFEHTPLGKGKRRQARIQNSCGFRRGGSRRLHPQITGKDETITVYWLKGKTVCLQAHVFPFFVF